MKEISAGIIIYRKTQQDIKFLLLYHGGGYWNFPKGKIESPRHPTPFAKETGAAGQAAQRETSWQAAIREVREETGLKLADLKFRRQFKTFDRFMFYREKMRVFKIVILYLAETHRPEIELSKEHDGYAWLTYKEAMKILKYKDSQRIITQANNFIRRGRYGNSPNMSRRPVHRFHRPYRPSPIPKDKSIS